MNLSPRARRVSGALEVQNGILMAAGIGAITVLVQNLGPGLRNVWINSGIAVLALPLLIAITRHQFRRYLLSMTQTRLAQAETTARLTAQGVSIDGTGLDHRIDWPLIDAALTGKRALCPAGRDTGPSLPQRAWHEASR